jgi:hypothetical protein
MAATRKNSDKYYLGEDVLGRPAWLLRNRNAGAAGGAGSSANLLDVAGEGVGWYESLPVLLFGF